MISYKIDEVTQVLEAWSQDGDTAFFGIVKEKENEASLASDRFGYPVEARRFEEFPDFYICDPLFAEVIGDDWHLRNDPIEIFGAKNPFFTRLVAKKNQVWEAAYRYLTLPPETINSVMVPIHQHFEWNHEMVDQLISKNISVLKKPDSLLKCRSNEYRYTCLRNGDAYILLAPESHSGGQSSCLTGPTLGIRSDGLRVMGFNLY